MKEGKRYLSDLDAGQRRREQRRADSDRIAQKLQRGGDLHLRIGKRMSQCSLDLEMGWDQDSSGKPRLKMKSRWRCRCRYCPECQSVRNFQLRQRLNAAIPELLQAYPTAGFLTLDLTVKNCPIHELRTTLTHMAESWQRLIQHTCWPALGWIRTMEVTRAADGLAHPHFHCLLMVPADYFNGRSYLTHKQWAAEWQDALRVEYQPIVYIKRIPPDPASLGKAIAYMTKAPRLEEGEDDWFLAFVEQMHKTRAFATGGILKDLVQVATKRMHQDIAQLQEDKPGGVRSTWRAREQKYVLRTPGALVGSERRNHKPDTGGRTGL